MKLFKFIIGLLLIPLSLLLAGAFVHSLILLQSPQRTEIFFLAGVVAYLLLHILLYRPVFMHVMAHEFTHAVWTLIFGGKVSEFHVTGKGGNVKVSRSNFLISLAPYFFPLYTVVVLLQCLIIKKEFYDYAVFFVGFTLSFHVILTIHSILQKQSDFNESGALFSYAFVCFANILVIAGVFAAVSPQFKFMAFLKDAHNILGGLIGANKF